MAKREIKARDFLHDIRSGVSDSQLMEKYRLTQLGLRSALRKLADAGAIQAQEIHGRFPEHYSTLPLEGFRQLPRRHLDFPLPVAAAEDPRTVGIVLDISPKGVGIVGIEANEGEVKSFVIAANDFFQVEPVTFEARCRWIRKDVETGSFVSGFEIIRVSRGDLKELRKLIQALTIEE